jgi:hypothetical protein
MTRASVLSILAGPGAVISIALFLSACTATTRPAEPPRGSAHRVPDGAILPRQSETPSGITLGDSLSHALDHRFAGDLERDARGRPVFRVLALSGGGSRGAYGAGVLAG